ncbi:MAG: cobalt ECF transporter T component CbiQ [Candidatus Firestonebacteria bacterium]|nr:cobalt ECF transporter T component CbiQ [Candidatus Firestonebacteria bacterium]
MELSYIDRYSELDSPIHKLDPRVKTAAFFMYILFVVTTLPGEYLAYALFFLLMLFVIILSKVSLLYILKRSLAIIPFVLIISVFLPFSAPADRLFAGHIKVNNRGLELFFNIVIKAWLSIIAVTIFSATTAFPAFLKGLNALHFPKIIVLMLSFMYRYSFVLLEEVTRINTARKSRSPVGNTVRQLKTVGNIIGLLFIRTYERGERIYQGMLSRGFNGEINIISKLHIGKYDCVFLTSFILALVIIKIKGAL